MRIFCWNCRGVGNTATVRKLHEFTNRFAPTMLCIMETQTLKSWVESLVFSLGYDNCFAVSSSGKNGGLGVFWNNSINLEVFRYSKYHIDSRLTLPRLDTWRLTCFYGEAQSSERFKTWDTLHSIQAECDCPWLCIGNFNGVLQREEHVGIGQHSFSQIAGF